MTKRLTQILVSCFLLGGMVQMTSCGNATSQRTSADKIVTLSEEYAEIDVGSEFQLEAVTSDNDKYRFTWSSSDTNVATVDRSTGLVRAVAPGESVITVKVAEKGKYKILDTATCRISVNTPADYYEMIFGSEAKNAEVIAHPGKWYFFTTATASSYSSKSAYYMGGKAYVSFTDFSKKEWYLRYQPELPVGTAYDVNLTMTLSDAMNVRFGGLDEDIALLSLDEGENSFTLSNRTVDASRPLSINMLTNPQDHTSYLSGTFSFSIDRIEFVRSIKISSKTASIDLTKEDKTIRLTAEDPENGTLTWTSDHEEIASVDQNGLVTGKSDGTAKITVSNQKGQSVSCVVDVYSKTVEIDRKNGLIDLASADKTLQLNAMASDGSAIEWSSQDETIATVDANGLVRAIGKGKTVITAMSGAIQVSCDLVVADSRKSLDPEGYEIIKGNKDCKHDVVISDPGIWYFYTSKKSSITESTYKNGTVRITTSAAAIASDTPALRIQPLFALGTKVRVRFDIELTDGITLDSFKIGNGTDRDCLSDLQSGQKSFETEIVVSGTTSFSIKCKYATAGTITVSNISFTQVA